jgi:hypothetical protein
MEDMPIALVKFYNYICAALAHWGYEYDGSKVKLALDTMLGEMTREDVEDLVDFVDAVEEQCTEEYMINFNYDPVGQYLQDTKYALGFVMMISDEYAVEHFNEQLEDINEERI